MNVTQSSARRIVRNLKRGVFPHDDIDLFTAGRENECVAVNSALGDVEQGGNRHFFLEASYGYGKSHMLKLIEAIALKCGFAVSWVTTDNYAHAFNHPSRYLHALLENLRVPNLHRCGLAEACYYWLRNSERENILKWASSQAPIAFRGPLIDMGAHEEEDSFKDWHRSRLEGRDIQHKSGRPHFLEVIERLAATTALCRAASLKGTVFLFDEVESVATLLANVKSRLLSYELINSFIDVHRFPHSLFVFASTVDFGIKVRIDSRDCADYGYPEGNRFAKRWSAEDVTLLKLKPIGQNDNCKILRMIRTMHEIAYDWSSDKVITESFIEMFVKQAKLLPQREITRSFITILEICQQHPNCNPQAELAREQSTKC